MNNVYAVAPGVGDEEGQHELVGLQVRLRARAWSIIVRQYTYYITTHIMYYIGVCLRARA